MARTTLARGVEPTTPARGNLGCVLIFVVPLLLFVGIFAYVFLFSTRYTSEYACVLNQVGESGAVVEAIGEPVEPGLLVWTSYFSQEGSTREASFGFQVSGPRGQGQVDARTYRTPIGSSMTIWYEGKTIYNGSYPCR